MTKEKKDILLPEKFTIENVPFLLNKIKELKKMLT